MILFNTIQKWPRFMWAKRIQFMSQILAKATAAQNIICSICGGLIATAGRAQCPVAAERPAVLAAADAAMMRAASAAFRFKDILWLPGAEFLFRDVRLGVF